MAGRLALAATLAVAATLAGGGRSVAHADGGETSPEALAAARALFAEALRDESARRFEVALDEFRRVRNVRDTPAIEYRIGRCLEGLHQPAPAYDAYRAAVALGQGDTTMAGVVTAARQRMDELSGHVARLRVSVPPEVGADLEVRVDGDLVARERLAEPLSLEPGTHVVTVTSKQSAPFRGEIALPEGGQATLTPTISPTATPAIDTAPPAPRPSPEPARGRLPEGPPSGGGRAVGGGILTATGGALLVGSLVTLLVRSGDIASLDQSCPRGQCPATANEGTLESTRNRALAEGPIGAALAGGGVIAAGLGIYLLWTSRARPVSSGVGAPGDDRRTVLTRLGLLVPTVQSHGVGAGLAGSF